MKKILFSIVGCLCFLVFTSAQDYGNKIEYLEKYIESARGQWAVPGLSVVIIKDGITLSNRGYGVRQLGSDQKVDDKTIFAICSTTKAIVAASMAMLIDEGKADWDDKLVSHMPSFQLKDPYITRELKIRDLFTHNTGMGNADLLWAMWVYSPDEILHRMRYLDASYSFRGGYTYQNIMYAAAGKLIETLSGQSWGSFVQERIFEALGMKNSFPTLASSMDYSNRSIPHHYVSNKISIIPDRSADPIGPAGSIWSCTNDMQKWIKFILNGGVHNGKRLISEKNFKELLTPHAIVSENGFYPTQQLTKPNWRTYALGWFQHDYRGRAVSFHTGSLRGTVAIIGLIPDENLGVYVFGNLDHAEVRHAIMYKVFDVFGKNDPNIDWSSDLLELYTGIKKGGKERYEANLAKRKPGTNTRFSLSEYAGVYSNTFLGDIIVSYENGELRAAIGEETVALRHFHYDTFRMKWLDQPWSTDSFVSFDIGNFGDIHFDLFGHEFKRSVP